MMVNSDLSLRPDARHVDVAILYGMGMEDRAQVIARKLRPEKLQLESCTLAEIGSAMSLDNE